MVENSDNFVFLISKNIFASEWCMTELYVAHQSKKNIILVTHQDDRWGSKVWILIFLFYLIFFLKNERKFPFVDKICFQEERELLIKAGQPKKLVPLKQTLREVLTRKSIEYSQAYCSSFLTKLMEQLAIKK